MQAPSVGISWSSYSRPATACGTDPTGHEPPQDGYAGTCEESMQNPMQALRNMRPREEGNVYGDNPGEAARIGRGMAGCCLMDAPGCGWS